MKKNKKAFTLIEVLVIVLLIGIIIIIMASITYNKVDKEISQLQELTQEYNETINKYKGD